MADLGDRRDLDRMVQLAVPAPRQPMHTVTTGTDLDGRGAVVGREAVTIREAADVAGLTDGDRGTDRTDAEHLGRGRSGGFDRFGDALLGGAHLLIEATQVLEVLERQRALLLSNFS